jgi:hypothetical protein
MWCQRRSGAIAVVLGTSAGGADEVFKGMETI